MQMMGQDGRLFHQIFQPQTKIGHQLNLEMKVLCELDQFKFNTYSQLFLNSKSEINDQLPCRYELSTRLELEVDKHSGIISVDPKKNVFDFETGPTETLSVST